MWIASRVHYTPAVHNLVVCRTQGTGKVVDPTNPFHIYMPYLQISKPRACAWPRNNLLDILFSAMLWLLSLLSRAQCVISMNRNSKRARCCFCSVVVLFIKAALCFSWLRWSDSLLRKVCFLHPDRQFYFFGNSKHNLRSQQLDRKSVV